MFRNNGKYLFLPAADDSGPSLLLIAAVLEYNEAEVPLELLLAGEDCKDMLFPAAAAEVPDEDFNRGNVLLPLISMSAEAGVSGML